MNGPPRCPYCGGILVWDYSRGDVVCSVCGAVVDRIYTAPQTKVIEENLSVKPNSRNRLPRSYKLFVKISRRIKNSKKELIIDSKKFQSVVRNGEKPVNLLYSRRDDPSQITVEKDPVIREILEKTIRKNPRLASRTLRGKVAAALLVKYLFLENRKPDPTLFREVANMSGSSLVHVRRIYALVRRMGNREK